MTIKHEQIVVFLRQRIVVPHLEPAFLAVPAQVSVGFKGHDGVTRWFTDAITLGAALADDAGFQELRLGRWLNTPDNQLIAAAVAEVLPPAYRPEYQLVVDGLKFAAARQRSVGWQRAAGLATIAGIAVWAIGRGRAA